MFTPFPHFAPLPPASARQAAQVYALLRVTPRMVRYDRLTSALATVAEAYILVLYWLILETGLAAAIRNLAERIASRWLFAQAFVAFVLITAAVALAGLPLALFRAWYVPHEYGLTAQSVGAWLGDHAKSIGVDAGIDGLIAGALLALIRRFPRRWPILFAVLMTPIIAFGIFLSPLVIDPLFHHYSPLPPSSPYYARLHWLTRKAGVPHAPIYVVDMSRETNETNAYVTGIGPSMRIVVWDTLLERMTPSEVTAVVGHELGHYVEGHLVLGFVASSLALFVAFPLLAWLARAALSRFGPRWRLRSTLADPAALALLLLVLQIGFLAAQPITNAASRWIEHRADAFSLGLVRNRVALARAFVALAGQDLEDPYPPEWEKIWFDNHPPLGERIRFALYGQP